MMPRVTSVVIIGGGPGGYEAALVASQLGGSVTLIERDGLGGAAVLTDCVPSKTLIATADIMATMESAGVLGLSLPGSDEVSSGIAVDIAGVNARVVSLAQEQSRDIRRTLEAAGVRVIIGSARLDGTETVVVTTRDGSERIAAEVILVATGTTPRELAAARPDGERILTWKQVYGLTELPEHLIVVGSGVTGAEFANAYDQLHVPVTLVSSRDMVLPGQDEEAARVLQSVFERRGMRIMSRSRAVWARRTGDGVTVGLADGRTIEGSHVLMAVGSIPNTAGLGLEEAGIALGRGGHITVDRVSRTSARGVYAAGDVTGVFALASVAAMQGRIAMWHSLGEAVSPLDLRSVSSCVFTSPEIATVGVSHQEVDIGEVRAHAMMLPLRNNPRAKMQGVTDGFVKLYCLPTTGIIIGGVVVAPRASELIHSVALAVANRITVEQFAGSFTVYPSMSGSVTEAARRLFGHADRKVVSY